MLKQQQETNSLTKCIWFYEWVIVIKHVNNQWNYFFSQIFTRLALNLSFNLPLKTSYNWHKFFKKEQKDPHVPLGAWTKRIPHGLMPSTSGRRMGPVPPPPPSWGRYLFLKFSLLCYFSGSLPDKKFDVDKRAMNLGDFNDIMRKDRSGFRPPNSKDMGTTDSGPYFEKVSQIL